MNHLSAGERLKSFRDLAFEKSWMFAHALEMDAASLHKYLRGDSLLGGSKLILLYRAGCNPTWYLTGEGSMFADNEAGHTLAAKILEK